MTSKRLALLVVGPDVVGNSQRCEVEIFRTSTLEYLAKELESQIQFFSTNCMISLIEIFDYNKGHYVPLSDVQRQLEDRARLRVKCARTANNNNNNTHFASSDHQNQDENGSVYKTQQYSSQDKDFQATDKFRPQIDRELESKAEAIRQRASSPEALQRFKSTTPDYGGAVGRATMIGKALPSSSALFTNGITSNIDGTSPVPTPRGQQQQRNVHFNTTNNNNNNNNNQMSSARSAASSRKSNGTSLDDARRLGSSMSYLNGPTNRSSIYNEETADHESASHVSYNWSPQREYQQTLIKNYQKQQTQNYETAEKERNQKMSAVDDRFHQAATRSMSSHQPHFSPPVANNNTNNNNNSPQQQQQHQQVSPPYSRPTHSTDRPQAYVGNGSAAAAYPENITIFCVYNGPDGQRAKAITVSRKKPDLNQVMNTLESKFQLPLCLGYIDPDSGDCEEVKTQMAFAQILNDRSHMHDPNAGCTFQCWMRVMEENNEQQLSREQKFENSRKSVNVNDNAEIGADAGASYGTNDNSYYSPNNSLHHSTPGRHADDSGAGIDQQISAQRYVSRSGQNVNHVIGGPQVDPPHFSPERVSPAEADGDEEQGQQQQQQRHSSMSSVRRAEERRHPAQVQTPPPTSARSNNNNKNDRHRMNRNATISPNKVGGENTATKISQYALQRLQALEAEQARRESKNTPTPRNNNNNNSSNNAHNTSMNSMRQTPKPLDTRSMISVVSAAPSTVLVTEDQLRETFDELDLEGSGFVTKAAMRHWYDKNIDTMGVPGCDKKFEKMLATAKRRHDLDYQEYCVVMLKIAQW